MNFPLIANNDAVMTLQKSAGSVFLNKQIFFQSAIVYIFTSDDPWSSWEQSTQKPEPREKRLQK